MGTLEFQVIDVDYFLVNEKPIVRIFGKTKESDAVCGFYEGYQPYMYTNSDPTLLLEQNTNVVKIEQTDRKKLSGETGIYKIILKNPAKTPETREFLFSKKLEVFEADILFKNRFMADFGFGGLDWIKVEYENTNTNVVSTKRVLKLKLIERIEKEDEVDFKILALDIECVSQEENRMPEAKKDPVILIGLTFSHKHKGQESIVLGLRSGKGITSFETEEEMLKQFIDIILDYDPDFVTAFNGNSFDFPYLLERMMELKINPIFSRCRQKPVMAKTFGNVARVTMVGRVVVDSLEIIRTDYSLTRYGLAFVAPALLGKEKGDVKPSEMLKFWKGSQDKYEKLSEYCRNDVSLALELVQKLNLLNKYKSLAKVSGVLLQDALDSGEAGRIEHYLLRIFNKKGYVFPCKPEAYDVKERVKNSKILLKGGFVLDPKPGLHSNVVVLDFKSMYPSIIRTFNVCPTTKVRTKDFKEEDVLKTAANVCYYKHEIRKGIIPEILEHLMISRDVAKKKLKNEKDPLKKSMYHGEQWALKILANAFYGYLGYARARIYDLDIANTITSEGRAMIGDTIKKINEKGFEVLYSDTDSVFVQMKTENMEEIKKVGSEIANNISEGLPGVMELQFEKVFKRFLPLSKKRYVAWKFEPTKEGWEEKMEMKGVETVRRDWCPLTTKTMKKIIDIVLKESDPKKAVSYFKDIIMKLNKNEIEINDLTITKTITKKVESYDGVQPHVEVVKKMISRGENPGLGDRISYVIVKGTGLLSKRAEDPVYVTEKGLSVDSRYYMDNQLFPPLERIFVALGIEKTELIGGGKQIGLFEAMGLNGKNGHNIKKTEDVFKATLSDVNGFVCKTCSKFYPRPSLIGTCECGGEFLFNSLKGPVEEVVVN